MSKDDDLSEAEKHTIEEYDRLAEERAAQYSSTRYWARQYQHFKELLPISAHIIDIGCGDGRDAVVFTDMGLQYTGIDLSDGMLAIARSKNLQGCTFLKRNLYKTELPDNSFTGFWATSSLVHVPKSRIDKGLQEIKRITKDGGIGFIAMKQGEGEHTVPSTLAKDNRVWTFYQADEFAEALERNGYNILAYETYTYEKAPPFGTTWILYWIKVTK